MRILVEFAFSSQLARLLETPSPPGREMDGLLPPALQDLLSVDLRNAIRIPGESYRRDRLSGDTQAKDRDEDSTIVLCGKTKEEHLPKLAEVFERGLAGGVVGVFVDLSIGVPDLSAATEDMLGKLSRNDLTQVEKLVCSARLSDIGADGPPVALAFVDNGISRLTLNFRLAGSRQPVLDDHNSLVLIGRSGPFESTNLDEHGTTMALTASVAGGASRFLDIACLVSGLRPRLCHALRAYCHLAKVWKRNAGNWGGLVVNNSWTVNDIRKDPPEGHPFNYRHNKDHPFSKMVETLAAEGVDVVFAAGNCGGGGTKSACDEKMWPATPPRGRTIYGANSHRQALTVGAVDLGRNWRSYSAEGPGYLECLKPDLCSYTDFHLFGTDCVLTSSACALTSGCIAGLRRCIPYNPHDTSTYPAAIRERLIDAAGSSAHDNCLGWGILDMCKVIGDSGYLV